MREIEFKNFLIGNSDIESKVKAVNSRVAKALMVERHLIVNLDNSVQDEEKMYDLLVNIERQMNDRKYHGVYSNAVRKYYLFVNGREFPKLRDFERTKGI